MLCQNCGSRQSCLDTCPELEAHLKSFEKYQRELPLDPRVLAAALDAEGNDWTKLSGDTPWIWDLLMPLLNCLPIELLTPFMLHYHEELEISEIAARLGVHRTTVRRRLDRAAQLVRGELGPNERRELRRRSLPSESGQKPAAKQ